ncbi:MAG: DUF349 domain-containing protein [Clostridium sp.]|nr:DUF349 domain-containing protein [Clostridium sp.]MCM1475510.1 DUF349 domain-containing protein [Muribaculaceae bacterium]
MNENEKMELKDEQTSTLNPQECGVNPRNEQLDSASVCSETSSPALDIADVAEEAQPVVNEDPAPSACTDDTEVCAEKESPALDIAEAADKSLGDIPTESETLLKDEAAELSKIQDLHALSKEELVEKLKGILEADDMQAHKDVTMMKQAFFNIRKREADEELKAFIEGGNNIEAFVATPCELENEFKKLITEFKTRRAEYMRKDEEMRQENLAKKLRTIDAIKALMDDVDNINRNYQEFQRLQQEFKAVVEVPQAAETEVWKQYQTAVEQFYDLLKLNKELRDLDFRKNLEAKRVLIEEAKKLADEPDVIAAFRSLQNLHTQWREIGPVAKDIRESIWEEFSEASSVVNRRHQEFYELRKANEQKNETAKIELCVRMEALDVDSCKTFADWDAMTEEIKKLQAEWKTLGFASRKANNDLFARFRKAIDEFFSRKSEFYQSMRERSKENLRKKIALCEKAEAIAEGEVTADSVRKLRDLQEEWKTIGSVDRKQSDIVWNRFLTVCNSVFDRRKKENDTRRQGEKENLETKKRIIADLTAIFEETEETGDSIRRMRALQDEWRQTGHVPFAKKEEINDAYYDMVRRLSDKLLGGRRKSDRRGSDRRERSRRDGRELSPRERILERIQAKKADLNTYENNMGFFNVKSAAGNSMVKELIRKIDRLKKEIDEFYAQLHEIDNPKEEPIAEATAEPTEVESTETTASASEA